VLARVDGKAKKGITFILGDHTQIIINNYGNVIKERRYEKKCAAVKIALVFIA
jgi:hypothetical protein